jgi:hypothetical protein
MHPLFPITKSLAKQKKIPQPKHPKLILKLHQSMIHQTSFSLDSITCRQSHVVILIVTFLTFATPPVPDTGLGSGTRSTSLFSCIDPTSNGYMICVLRCRFLNTKKTPNFFCAIFTQNQSFGS